MNKEELLKQKEELENRLKDINEQLKEFDNEELTCDLIDLPNLFSEDGNLIQTFGHFDSMYTIRYKPSTREIYIYGYNEDDGYDYWSYTEPDDNRKSFTLRSNSQFNYKMEKVRKDLLETAIRLYFNLPIIEMPKCMLAKTPKSKDEKRLYEVLKPYNNTVEFDNQTEIGYYRKDGKWQAMELDIYIRDKKVAVEVSSTWSHKEREEADLRKEELCDKAGIKLFKLWSDPKHAIFPEVKDNTIFYKANNKKSLELAITQLWYHKDFHCAY